MTEILLQELNSTDLDWMAATGDRRSLNPGDRLTLSAEHLYCLLDGEMATIETGSGDSSSGVSTVPLAAGDIFGGAALLDLPTFPQTYRATRAASVLAIPQTALRQKIQGDEAFAARFYRVLTLVLAQRLRQLYAQSSGLRQSHQRDLQEALLVLGELRDSDIDWLTVAGRVRAIAPGDFLLRAGRPIDALYLVLEGRFAVLWLEDENPLKVCFNCPIETASQMRQITTLAEGEMAGVSTFLDARPLPVSMRAEEEALVLSVPREVVMTRLLQDHGFAVRFYRVLAIQLSKMVQEVLAEDTAAGQERLAAQTNSPMEDDELDIDDLQHASQGAARFNWMRQRLGVG